MSAPVKPPQSFRLRRSPLLIQTATVDGQEVAAAFTVITLSATGPGGSIVFVPAETMVEIPGLRLDPLARAFEETGIDGAERTVRNLLGIDFDHVEVLDNETWASYVEPLGPLSVDNPGRLDTETDTLRIEVLYPAGPVTVDAPVVGEFLAAKGVSESGLLRLVRHQRFWEGVPRRPGPAPRGRRSRSSRGFRGVPRSARGRRRELSHPARREHRQPGTGALPTRSRRDPTTHRENRTGTEGQ